MSQVTSRPFVPNVVNRAGKAPKLIHREGLKRNPAEMIAYYRAGPEWKVYWIKETGQAVYGVGGLTGPFASLDQARRDAESWDLALQDAPNRVVG
jgi:hypothetical protein